MWVDPKTFRDRKKLTDAQVARVYEMRDSGHQGKRNSRKVRRITIPSKPHLQRNAKAGSDTEIEGRNENGLGAS